jgi:hypothetical protein
VQEILFEAIVITVAEARRWKEGEMNDSKRVTSVHLWGNMCSKDFSDCGVNSIYRLTSQKHSNDATNDECF